MAADGIDLPTVATLNNREAREVAAGFGRLFFDLFTCTPAARREIRCMGRRCPREAEVLVSVIDPTNGAHDHPVRLCCQCLARFGPDGRVVDLFRWLSDNRIEAARK